MKIAQELIPGIDVNHKTVIRVPPGTNELLEQQSE
jgi:hypothetical protein